MAHRKHPRLPVDQRLKIARADAIEAYSNLELALCRLLALLLGTKVDLAGIVFFRINNTRARSAALDSLLRHKYGTKYNLYWNSVFKLITQLDNERNQIVHWRTQLDLHWGRKKQLSSVTAKLMPPNMWDTRPKRPFITEKGLKDFGQNGESCLYHRVRRNFLLTALRAVTIVRPAITSAERAAEDLVGKAMHAASLDVRPPCPNDCWTASYRLSPIPSMRFTGTL